MERGQRGEFAEGFNDLVVDDDGLHELFAAVHDAVAHGGDPGEAVYDAVLLVGQRVDDQLDGVLMGGAILVHGHLLAAGRLDVDERAAYADALDEAGGHRGLGLPVEKQIFHGRAAAVQTKYFHVWDSPL